jgi:hypothetical protein
MLALRYSIISVTAAARTLPPGRLRAGKGCWGWAPPPLPPGPQDLPRDYGPDGAAGGLKSEYTAASGPRDLRERADDRDSEPDYLLRPTRHGPGDY